MYGCLATLRRFLLLTPEVQIVPKLAATLASLLLIASSIGVNIARYPQVGRIIDAGPPTATAAIANSEPARSPQIAVITPAENARVGGPFDPTPAAGPAEAAGGRQYPGSGSRVADRDGRYDSGRAADGPRGGRAIGRCVRSDGRS